MNTTSVSRRKAALFHGEFYWCDQAFTQTLHRAGLGPSDSWQPVNSESVSESPFGACNRLVLDNGQIAYAKTEHYYGINRLKYFLRPSRSGVEAFAYETLYKLKIPTPQVIAFGERRWFGIPLQTLIVTSEVPDSKNLQQLALNEWQYLPAEERKYMLNKITHELASQLRQAHAHNFIHHDLKWRNILVQRNGQGYRTIWFDAPRAAFWPLRKMRGRVIDLSDLSRLALEVLSVYDRMRFLLRYLGKNRRRGQAKKLWLAAERRTNRRRK